MRPASIGGSDARRQRLAHPLIPTVAARAARCDPTHAIPSSAPGCASIPREQHGISRKDISPNALRVLYRLRDAGFDGYLVGGAVRDLLVGGHPKDFDVATDATPEAGAARCSATAA